MARRRSYPGSIERRGDSLRIRLCVDGERHYFTLPTLDQKVAERFAREKERELRKNAARKKAGLPGQLRISELFDWFEETHLPTKAPNTQRSYRDALKPLRHFFEKVLDDPLIADVFPGHVKHYLTWRRTHGPSGRQRKRSLSNRTIQLDRSVLHKAFEEAISSGYLDLNPVSSVEAPKAHKRKPVILSETQLERLLKKALKRDPFLHLYVLTLAETGARCESEVLWLKWDDVDLKGGFLWIDSSPEHRTKSGEGRWVPMTPRLKRAMQEHFALFRLKTYKGRRTPWVFHHTRTQAKATEGQRLGSLRRSFEKACEEAKLPSDFRQHDLRHRRITTWLAVGKDVVKVKEAVGHANLATTMGYTHLAREHLKSLVEEEPEKPGKVG